MLAAIASLGPWLWIIAGLSLMLVELMAPGLFFIWLGLAALATGVAVGLSGVGWTAGSLIFAALAVLAVLVGRRLAAGRGADGGNGVNAPARGLVGRVVRLDHAIENGEGRLRIDDTVWPVSGPDMAAGAMARIVRLDGATVMVEPAAAPAAPAPR